MGCECGGCQRGAEAVPVILRCCSPPGFGCVFAGTGVKTVSPNENHSWWGGEPHNTPIGETKNFYPEILRFNRIYINRCFEVKRIQFD